MSTAFLLKIIKHKIFFLQNIDVNKLKFKREVSKLLNVTYLLFN